ncbi:MAG: hypothetical protein KF690_01775 [Bacteroidetes bacterium]|nr:hypothetical protein [Bacteroidota bacterium]
MSFEKDIEKLNKAYESAEGENREETVAALAKLHATTEKDNAQRQAFYALAAQACGGCYIPYLFWTALSRFYDAPESRDSIYDLLQAFATGDFEEADQQLMKPLIVIYFAKEKEFEVDKVRARLLVGVHPSVKAYFDGLVSFLQNNKVAVQTYRDKFALLRKGMPDFARFSMPLSKLEEQLA